MTEITVLLSSWKRTDLLAEQIDACRRQTLCPKEIWVWQESAAHNATSSCAHRAQVEHWIATTTPGTYGRFSAALLSSTDIVAVLDDDMLPMPGFLETCASLVQGLGTAVAAGGMRLCSDDYSDAERFGWETRSATATEVDIGLNAWVLRKAWLPVLWLDEPPNLHNGEDIHLSWALKKYLGRSICTPPQADTSVIASYGDFGQDNVALCRLPNHQAERTRIVRHFLRKGWKTVGQIDAHVEV